MAFRAGLGPVFAYEWLTATRRPSLYLWRAAFVGLILLGLVFVWKTVPRTGNLGTIARQAQVGRQFYQTLVFIELCMVLLAAPAATAGAICLDKARGTLFHVLATDLSDAEIVLGKLAARLVPVLGLILSSLPVLALGTLLGGIDPWALTGSYLVLVGVALLGCTLALTLSVWGRKTHEVLLVTYVALLIWVLLPAGWEAVSWAFGFGGTVPDCLVASNLFVLTVAAHEPSARLSPGLPEQFTFLVAAAVLSAALLALTILRLRSVIIGQWGRPERSRRRAGRPPGRPSRWFRREIGPSLDGNPVLWREWHRRRPSGWARVIWGLYLALSVLFGGIACSLALRIGPASSGIPELINGIQVAVGLLLLSTSSATSLSEERARGSLDVLLATPLSTAAVVWGKWWGAFRSVPLLAVLPLLVVAMMLANSQRGEWLCLPLIGGLVLAYGSAIVSLGLALATWIPRVGRVLSLCVGAVVCVTIGTIFMAAFLFQGNDASGPGFAMGSPLAALFLLSFMADRDAPPPHLCSAWSVWAFLWIVAYVAIAVLLLFATLATFDRCLGRIPERPARPRIPGWAEDRKKSTQVVLEEV